jgi:regulatory protein
VKGAGGGIVRVHLSDGSSFVLHGALVLREGISADRELTPREISSLQSRSEMLFARQSALSLLSRAAHTRRGLALKLQKRGFGARAVQKAVARMAELGYLDDRSFAELWARRRMDSRREGWKALFKGLVRNGVPRELAAETATQVCTDEAELAAAREVAGELPPKKAVSRLTARGFRSRTIARVLREIGGRAPAGGEE